MPWGAGVFNAGHILPALDLAARLQAGHLPAAILAVHEKSKNQLLNMHLTY